MAVLHVCLLYGGHTSLILVNDTCKYDELVELIISELGLNCAKVSVKMTYSLDSNLPPVRILSDNNVLTYLRLKSLDGSVSSYPIMLDIISADLWQPQYTLQCPETSTTSMESSASVFPLQQIAQEICDSVVTVEKENIEEDVTLVSEVDARAIVEGNVFRGNDILKMSLAFYAIQNKFEYKVLRSDKKEYVVKCLHNDCKWIFRSSRLGETKMFKIREMCKGHTCSMNIVLGSHRQASCSVVSNCIRHKYTSSRTVYTPNDISNDMLHKYGVSVNYVKAWRSREQTLKLIRGDPTTSFQLLPSYFFMLQQMNIGTVTRIETDHSNRFKYCFMALGASIAGWKYCRPVIVVDGTYLNGHYGGTLFTACTQDANNNIFILAFGIGDNENDKSWRWFLEMLKRAFGSRDGLCIVSDRHNSIRNAIEFVYPEAMHGICSYHLLRNLKTHFAKSRHNITHAFNSAVRAYTMDEFEYQMQQLDSMNEGIREYLMEVGYEKWSRLHMPNNRYSTMTSNIVESVNAVTKAAKNYPIQALVESLRQTVQSWFCKNRDNALGTFTKLATKYEKLLREISNDVRNMKVSPTSQTLFEVRDNSSSYMIDITQHTCSCRMFQVDQLPCPHALAVIATLKLDVYDFCSVYYTRDAYLNTYKETVFPVGNKSEWNLPEDVHNRVVLAPNQKRSSGRPTEKRKKPACERSQVMKCGRCNESGHNRRTCRNLVPLNQNNEKLKAKKDPKKFK